MLWLTAVLFLTSSRPCQWAPCTPYFPEPVEIREWVHLRLVPQLTLQKGVTPAVPRHSAWASQEDTNAQSSARTASKTHIYVDPPCARCHAKHLTNAMTTLSMIKCFYSHYTNEIKMQKINMPKGHMCLRGRTTMAAQLCRFQRALCTLPSSLSHMTTTD